MTSKSTKTNYLTDSRGILAWFFTLDHKRVAVMYLTSILTLLVVGSLLALLNLVATASAEQTVISPDTFSRAFSLHGVIMVFAVLLPSFPATLGYFLLPMMLGAPNMVFPRFTLLSFHLWALGILLMTMSACAGGLDTGWTFSLPLATLEIHLGVAWMAAGIFCIGLSTILTCLNLIATIGHGQSAAANGTHLPMLVWTLKIAAWIQLVTAPVVCVFFALLIAERAGYSGLFGSVFLGNAFPGDASLSEHLYWLGVHPAAFVLLVPAIGMISDLISVHRRKPLVGYPMVVGSAVAIGLLGLLGWGTHLFMAVHPPVLNAVSSAFALSLFVPGSIILLCWLATLYRAATELNTPMLYGLAAAINLTIGGLAGLFLAIPSTGAFLHNTYFSTAQIHYLFLGGVVFALLGGVTHAWSKIAGREYSTTTARLILLILFLSFHATFFPVFLLGSHGLLSRQLDHGPRDFPMESTLHSISLTGGILLVAGFITLTGLFIYSMMRGKPVTSENPWETQGREWQTASPPPPENFSISPTFEG